MPRETVDPKSYDYLSMRKFVERVPDYSYAILDRLESDPNIELYGLLSEYVSKGGKIGLEDMRGYLRCHVWSKECQQQRLFNIVCEVGTQDEEAVQEETYVSLQGYCVDFDEIEEDTQYQLRNAR